MITPTPEQVENSLRWWVALGSGLASKYVSPGNSGKPAHNDPYATLLFILDTQPGKPVQRRVLDGAGDIDETTQAVVRGRYSVQWHRDGDADAYEAPGSASGPIPPQAGTLPRLGCSCCPRCPCCPRRRYCPRCP